MSALRRDHGADERKADASSADLTRAGYRLRPPLHDDLHRIATLIKACDRADTGEALRSDSHLIANTRTDRFELACDAWLIVDQEGAPAGFAWLFEPLPHAELEGEIYVRPADRGRGLEESLLSLLEERARAHLPLAPPPGTVSLALSCHAGNRAARDLYQRAGFVKVREFYHMEVDLRPPTKPPRPLPAGVAPRAFCSPGDERPVYEALTEAFAEEFRNGEESYEAWRRCSLDRDDVDTGLWVVAERGNEVVGAVISFVEEGTGHVSDIGVKQAWRRRGLGSALLSAAFERLRAQGCSRAWLSVDAENPTGAVRVYEGVGMRVVRRFDMFVKELRPEGATSRSGEHGRPS